jgi:uncharacterized membrane protein YgcG
MKKSLPCLFIALPAIINVCSAQAIATLQTPPAKIAIDGSIKEWGDSLRYYNAEEHINYAIANTRDTIYMAVRVNDRSEAIRILKAGLTFTIDPKGKKKEAFSITFPLNTQGGDVSVTDPATEQPAGEVTGQERDELLRERLTTLRGIKVEGFKDIEGDMITTSNTYGIQAAVNYDDNGYLVCEAAIPISFFHADDITKNEWSFNFRINGLQRNPQAGGAGQQGVGGRGSRGGGFGGGMGGGRHGGRGGGRSQSFGGQGHGAMFKSEDFWTKFYLAK